ncbi:hypothetical protein AVEN_254705-1 [Araneus ventricosus]|uniref:Uncharacterized protein n=1 Tax=Araneus ventricosus TaxID=182803 RepID=A0A4Y2K529_ARAVE|nr:hypothetical protein AVEN_254705-1 [Araneus ventricosus]
MHLLRPKHALLRAILANLPLKALRPSISLPLMGPYKSEVDELARCVPADSGTKCLWAHAVKPRSRIEITSFTGNISRRQRRSVRYHGFLFTNLVNSLPL